MSEEGIVEDGDARQQAPVLLLLEQAERVVRARPRHSLPRRLARAARAALQSHLPALKVASRIPLAPERAQAPGLFRSGALETHIARALGNTVGLDDGILTTRAAKQDSSSKLFSAVTKNPSLASAFPPLQLSGKHPVSDIKFQHSFSFSKWQFRVELLILITVPNS